jgi:hypothetical protein
MNVNIWEAVPRRAEAVTFGGKRLTEASAMEPGKLI